MVHLGHAGEGCAGGARGIGQRPGGRGLRLFGAALDHRGRAQGGMGRLGVERRALEAGAAPEHAAQAQNEERRDQPEQNEIDRKPTLAHQLTPVAPEIGGAGASDNKASVARAGRGR